MLLSRVGLVRGTACRGLATTARRDVDRYFTKKHEWVLVDGGKGEDCCVWCSG
jgi:hypothetical protein